MVTTTLKTLPQSVCGVILMFNRIGTTKYRPIRFKLNFIRARIRIKDEFFFNDLAGLKLLY